MLTLLFLFLLIFTLILSKKIYKNYISPLSIFLGNFFLAFTIFYSVDFIDQDLSGRAFTIILVSLIAFLFGVTVFHLVKKPRNINKTAKKNLLSEYKRGIAVEDIKIFRFLFLLSLIGYLYFLYKIEKQLGLLNVLVNPNLLNVAFAFDEISLSSVPMYLMKLSMVNSMFLLIYILKFKPKRKQATVMFIIEVLMNISVKRNILLYIIVLNIIIFLYFNGRKFISNIQHYVSRKSRNSIKRVRNYFVIASVGVTFIYFFTLTQSLLNKQSMAQGSLFGISLPSYIVKLISYYAANIASFDKYLTMDHNDVPLFGSTLRFFYKVLDQINLIDYQDNFLVLDFVYIPYAYNTTLGQFYIYTESGMIGLLLFYGMVGFVSTYLYYKYQKNKDDVILLYLSLISVILLFSIREYVMIFVDFWITLLVIFLFQIHSNKNYRKKKREWDTG
ncbi:O-antigen polymerase [Rossellomorea aquimaris]|nr:O-antigen polymerase [Rossellomorea aquimaris]WRP06318.1 O-antigen polymerase [Rossellomorea aquimaris]